MTNEHIEHLKVIQDVIQRMAGNSFLLKGWTVTLITGLFALGFKEGQKNAAPRFVLLALLPIGAFALLDMYYLWQERLFRTLYEHVRTTGQGDFAMNMAVLGDNAPGYWATAGSYSLWPFYGTLVAVVLLIASLVRST